MSRKDLRILKCRMRESTVCLSLLRHRSEVFECIWREATTNLLSTQHILLQLAFNAVSRTGELADVDPGTQCPLVGLHVTIGMQCEADLPFETAVVREDFRWHAIENFHEHLVVGGLFIIDWAFRLTWSRLGALRRLAPVHSFAHVVFSLSKSADSRCLQPLRARVLVDLAKPLSGTGAEEARWSPMKERLDFELDGRLDGRLDGAMTAVLCSVSKVDVRRKRYASKSVAIGCWSTDECSW